MIPRSPRSSLPMVTSSFSMPSAPLTAPRVPSLAAYLPAVAGFLLEKEVDTLTGIFAEPERPFVAIVGGSKVSSKIGVLDHLIDSADT